jgi:hypothetical protein
MAKTVVVNRFRSRFAIRPRYSFRWYAAGRSGRQTRCRSFFPPSAQPEGRLGIHGGAVNARQFFLNRPILSPLVDQIEIGHARLSRRIGDLERLLRQFVQMRFQLAATAVDFRFGSVNGRQQGGHFDAQPVVGAQLKRPFIALPGFFDAAQLKEGIAQIVMGFHQRGIEQNRPLEMRDGAFKSPASRQGDSQVAVALGVGWPRFDRAAAMLDGPLNVPQFVQRSPRWLSASA